MNQCKTCRWWAPNSAAREEEPLRMCRKLRIETEDEFGCAFHVGPNSTEVNVPQHTRGGEDMPLDPKPVPGPVHILIVTYIKDLPWLVQALRSLDRFATGFSGVTIAYPIHSDATFRAALKPFNVLLHPYVEVAGKGMLQHMVQMARAEQLCPSDTQFVMHMDSDCIMKAETTPAHYFTAGLPQYLYRSYESLIEEDPDHPGSKVISDCIQWQRPTESQLGFKVDHAYTMCRHPTIFPIRFYEQYRRHIARVHGMEFGDYMMAGRNAFPQNRMDFTAMGAFAFYRMKTEFRWIDITAEPYPKDRMKAFWSHGGITPEVQEEIDRLLR